MVQEEILRNISGTAEELKTLVEYYGTSIYEEQKRLNALLMDVIPKYERERQALMQSIENGVAVQLKGIKNQDEKSQIELICSCEKMLTDKLQWNPKKAAYCVQVIAVSLGVEVDTVKKINCPVKMEKELVKEPSQQTEKKKFHRKSPESLLNQRR